MRDHGTLNAHNHWFILYFHVRGSAWIEIHWNHIQLRAQSHMTSHYTWGSMTTLHDFGGFLGQPLDTFIWALINFMVTALCSCVKWPLFPMYHAHIMSTRTWYFGRKPIQTCLILRIFCKWTSIHTMCKTHVSNTTWHVTKYAILHDNTNFSSNNVCTMNAHVHLVQVFNIFK